MRAMVLRKPGSRLVLDEVPEPQPGEGQVLIRVSCCGVCRTDLHILDGDLPEPALPLIMGHQIVGTVAALGPGPPAFRPGDRVGVPWLGSTCRACRYCLEGRENLCRSPRFTGYQRDGGFAEYAVADARYCFPIPEGYPDLQAAPLLCAGLIGYRALRLAASEGEPGLLGIYGYGAAAHIVVQVARHRGSRIYAFTRPGDRSGQEFAFRQGAAWAGASDQAPPEPLDAAIIFAPVGALVPAALRAIAPGGVVVCAGIHMSDIPSFPYRWLWEERVIRSVANLTRQDGEEFLQLAPQIPVETTVHEYPLVSAQQALDDLREGRFEGAAVVSIG
ncbi:MAG: zinc-dependent alcohol dehydrogenase family protein [Armatimonadetes bacterium]|nr:zinc-dependent alcohol dehydrogenase family protein [Armatimonadota bacterium]